ncbi:MAG: hypothetical protein RJB01_1455, partial [Actinomycetota bacterium]
NAGGVTDGPLILRALADQGRRDGLLWWVTEDVRIRAHVRDSLGALLPKVVRGHGADTSAVLAITHWLHGDGVRANTAVERGIEDDPQHRLVNLLGLAITAGMPPRVWCESMADLSFETCRRGVIPVERDHQSV